MYSHPHPVLCQFCDIHSYKKIIKRAHKISLGTNHALVELEWVRKVPESSNYMTSVACGTLVSTASSHIMTDIEPLYTLKLLNLFVKSSECFSSLYYLGESVPDVESLRKKNCIVTLLIGAALYKIFS